MSPEGVGYYVLYYYGELKMEKMAFTFIKISDEKEIYVSVGVINGIYGLNSDNWAKCEISANGIRYWTELTAQEILKRIGRACNE